LNAGGALAFTAACVLVAGVLAAGRSRSWLANGIAVAAGAAAAMAVVLFTLPGGPGTIFPIVLLSGTVVLMLSGVAGAGIGAALRRLGRT
jgi:hypothetical protein